RCTAGGIDPDWAVDQRPLGTQNRRSEAETAHRENCAQAARQASMRFHCAAQRQASVMTALSAFTWRSRPATPGRAAARAWARSSALAYATHTVEDARADETCIAGRADGPASLWGASEQAVMSSSTATESTGVRFTTHLQRRPIDCVGGRRLSWSARSA